MRPCVIFNPAAKGEKARKFRAELNHIAARSVFKFTSAAGDARRYAAEAIFEGHDTVVAAGGDGTLNEVVNGMGDVPDGFNRTRLGFVPLGTVNVFARELGIPLNPHRAWEIIEAGHETSVDLPWIEREVRGRRVRHHFTQLGGAGLDARAVELVDWGVKKRIGPLAYVLAGIRAMREPRVTIRVGAGDEQIEGALVLLGNGRLYGGDYRVFPDADPRDGLLDVCAFPNVNWWILIRCAVPLLLAGRLPMGMTKRLRARSLRLESPLPAAVQVDGESAGRLPVLCGVDPLALRVVVPG